MINEHDPSCGHLGLIAQHHTCHCAQRRRASLERASGRETIHLPNGATVEIAWGEGSPAGRTGFSMTFTPREK